MVPSSQYEHLIMMISCFLYICHFQGAMKFQRAIHLMDHIHFTWALYCYHNIRILHFGQVFLEMAHSRNKTPLPKPPPGSVCPPHDQDMMLGQKYLCIPQMKLLTDNVEGTKNDNTGETSNPKVASPSCNNEDQTSSSNQQCSKRIPSQLNAMAARVARRWIMKNRRPRKSQP